MRAEARHVAEDRTDQTPTNTPGAMGSGPVPTKRRGWRALYKRLVGGVTSGEGSGGSSDHRAGSSDRAGRGDRRESSGQGGASSTDRGATRGERGAFGALLGASRSKANAIPERIGRYKLVRVLGQGGMGIVYAAQDERLGRNVALKMLSSLANDETGRKRFWREARAAASVNHPNVCQLYEIGEEDGELFIAMELLEGESLADRLRRGALTVAEAMPISLDMLAALTALHTLGIVHRDLKPSNVYITPHGVKLLDFGLAQPIDPEGADALGGDEKLTRTGLVIGTPRYMAPEQVA